MLNTFRNKCRSIQAKYEKILATKSVFGFSRLYTEAMTQIHEREQRQHHKEVHT